MMKLSRDEALAVWEAFKIENQPLSKEAFENVVNNLCDEIDFLKTKTTNKTFAFSDVCPEYKTVEQFEMFIDSREYDIEMMNKAIYSARLEISKLKGNSDSYFRNIAKKFVIGSGRW